MNILLKKAVLGTALAASALTMVSPAEARPYYRGYHGGDATGAAVAGGVIGLALGALIASGANRHTQTYDYDQAYFPVYDGFYVRDGYYWDNDGRRYDRDWMARHYRPNPPVYRGYEYRSDPRRGYYSDGYYGRMGY